MGKGASWWPSENEDGPAGSDPFPVGVVFQDHHLPNPPLRTLIPGVVFSPQRMSNLVNLEVVNGGVLQSRIRLQLLQKIAL